MARAERIEYEGAYYHVMNRGRGRQTVFHGKAYYEAFIECLDQAHRRFGLEVHAYCLMGNHYHLLVRTPKANLGRAMRHINGVYTQHHNRLKRSDGPLFRGRYKAMNVEAASYLLEVSRYIHRNPTETKRPMVERLEDYPWSSYPFYRNKTPTPNWLIKDVVLSELGSGQPTSAYRRFVEGGVDEELAEFYAKGNWPAVLGSKDFAQSAYLHALSDSKEISRAKNYLPFEQVVLAVSKHFGCSEAVIFESKRGVRNEKRALAMKLSQEKTGETLEQLAKRFGMGSYGAVSQTITRLNRLLEKDEGLKKRYDDISRDLTP